MSEVLSQPAPSIVWTAVDLAERFGPIPLHRIRIDPPPGTAVEQDVIDIELREDRLFELADGVLVEKAMGFYESYLAGVLVQRLGGFAGDQDLGIVLPPDGMMRLSSGLVRIPDVSFVSWNRLPQREVPRDPIADLIPDLVVEVISRGNTRQEMDRKLAEYFDAGVRLVWYVYPEQKEVRVFTSTEKATIIGSGESLDGGEVLPGFLMSIDLLFEK